MLPVCKANLDCASVGFAHAQVRRCMCGHGPCLRRLLVLCESSFRKIGSIFVPIGTYSGLLRRYLVPAALSRSGPASISKLPLACIALWLAFMFVGADAVGDRHV